MFEVIHEVLTISAWTGLSVGALAAIVAVGYFFPSARVAAVRAAILVICVYVAVVHGEATGRRIVKAEWDQANVIAEQQRQERDAGIAAAATADADARSAALEVSNNDLSQKVADYEKSLSSGGACRLTDADRDRLRIIAGQPGDTKPASNPPGGLRKALRAGHSPVNKNGR
jgi:hypothetical protein